MAKDDLLRQNSRPTKKFEGNMTLLLLSDSLIPFLVLTLHVFCRC
jgi:hypothetical protein